MVRPDVTVMLCRRCKEKFNVLRDWAKTIKCPTCDGALDPHEQEAPGIDIPLGHNVGGCRLVKLIGRGEMGSVYRALHIGLRREVAVKMVPLTSRNKKIVKRLVFEARALARVEHPNIVQVYDVGLQHPHLYIVMQLVQGRTLRRVMRESIVDVETAVGIARQIAKGLFAAHSKGVVHRDLKPENVMISEDTVKIMDFGLAMDASSLDDLSGLVVGTPYYMAPEQWLGRRVDARADLYSLGVIFWWMLCRRRLFDPPSVKELMQMHVSAAPPPPHETAAVPEELSCIVLKLLAKDPDARYNSGKELLEDLDRYRRGEEVRALADFAKRARCEFCDALNPPGRDKCKVCGEPLVKVKASLDLQVRKGEAVCARCQNIIPSASRFCRSCGGPRP